MPPLERRTTHITLQTGVAEGTDPLSLQSGQLLQAENVRWRRDGAAEKRKGYSSVFTQKWSGGVNSILNAGEGRLVANDDELLLFDGADVVSYSPAQAAVLTGAHQICVAPRWSAFTTPLVSPPTTVISQAQAVYSSGGIRYAVIATVTQATYFSSVGGSATVAVFDADTGAPVGTTGLTAGSLNANTDIFCVHAFTVGSLVVVSYARSSTATIYARTLNLATLAWSGEQTLTTDNNTYGGVSLMYDVKPLQGSSTEYVLAFSRASNGNIAVLRITASTGATAATLELTAPAGGTYPATGIGISATSGGYTYITYGWDANDTNRTKLYLSRVTSGWALDAGFPVTVHTFGGDYALAANGFFCYTSSSACASVATTPTVAYSVAFYQPGSAGATTPWVVTWNTYSTSVAGTTVATPKQTAWMRLLSGLFVVNNRVSAVVQRDTGEWFGETFANVDGDNQFGAFNGLQQATCCVVDFTDTYAGSAYVVPLDTCTLFPAQLSVTDGAASFRPVTQHVDTTQLTFAVSTWAQAQERKRVHLCTLTRSDKYRWQAAKSDDGVYLSGGLVCTYDRTSVYPVGFTTDPVWCRVGETATAGGSGWNAGTVGPVTDTLNTTKYYFSVVWERVDKYGRISRSSPDYGVVKGAGSSSAVRLYSTAFSTATNAASILQVHYPGPSDWWDLYAGAGRNRSVLYGYRDDNTALKRYSSTITFAGISAVLTTQLSAPPTFPEAAPNLYTAGAPLGPLPHCQPPCLIGLVNYRNRLIGIDHTRRQLWFSKVMVQGEVAAFALDFTIPIPFEGEALGVLDDKLVVFGTDRIGVLEGSGPDDRGLGQPFSDVVLVCTDRGCIEPRSVVQTPLGLMYQAANGLMLMDRSGNQQFLGRPVQSTLESYPTVTSAVVHPTETVVLFSCISGENGVRLVYDYRLNRWSVDRIQENAGEGVALLSQVVCNGRLYALKYNGQVIVEDTASYIDLNSWIYMRVKFAAERLGGLQGYQRIWKVALIGEKYTDLDITVSLYGDDRSSADQTRTYEHATTSLTGPLRAEMRVKRQLSRALSVQVVDGVPTGGGSVGTGRGFSLSGVSLECGVESDLTRTAPNRRT